MAQDEAGRALLDWANLAPPADLAAELMPAFGPNGPGGGVDVSARSLAEWLFRTYPKPSDSQAQQLRMSYAKELRRPILEAVQVLEHAELVFLSQTEGPTQYSATRLGEAALANGKAVVRQRIRDRTGA
jgi:hypothetical protein